jgi:hypothetical protein
VNHDPDLRVEQSGLQPENNPISPEQTGGSRRLIVLVALVLLMALFITTGKARAAWEEIAQLLSL